MPWYHDHNELTAFLCLTYHSGQVKFVPGIIFNEESRTICIPSDDLLESLTGKRYSPLLLENIDLSKFGTDEDTYRQCVLSFLQDPGRSGKYAIGPDTYTKATSFFMKEISKQDWPLEDTFDQLESYLSGNVTFHDNIWTLNASTTYNHFGCKVMTTFLYLGYIIFFLPNCAKSETLLGHCQQQSFLTQKMIKLFPERTSVARQAMQDYLGRVGTEFSSECREDSDDCGDME